MLDGVEPRWTIAFSLRKKLYRHFYRQAIFRFLKYELQKNRSIGLAASVNSRGEFLVMTANFCS
jgi:hypothetical protein